MKQRAVSWTKGKVVSCRGTVKQWLSGALLFNEALAC
jgi:hypothetical protein